MMGTRPTNRDLREHVSFLEERVDHWEFKTHKAIGERDQAYRIIDTLERRLKYYENSNTPSSAESLMFKKLKAARAKERAEERAKEREKEKSGEKAGEKEKNGDRPPPRKPPGGRPGHKGTSRKHDPADTVRHDFPDGMPVCTCGAVMEPGTPRVRDIVSIIPAWLTEIRHFTQTARCPCCSKTAAAPDDLPARGSYDKTLVSYIATLRSEKNPLEAISRIMKDMCGLDISKSGVNGVLARVADAMEPEVDGIIKEIRRSDTVNIDETTMPLDGETGWAWCIRTGKSVFVRYSTSRGSLVLDTYMNGYDGVVVSDGFSVYKRFDPGGMHQTCTAHLVRKTRQLVEVAILAPDGVNMPERRHLYEDVRWILGYSKKQLSYMQHSPRLRHYMECMADAMLEPYRRIKGDRDLERAVAALDRALPQMFAFMEHPGVEPTNNAAERALRYVVVFRKISGQIKGGAEAMRRMSNFVTCVQTWWAQGRSVAQEVARLI